MLTVDVGEIFNQYFALVLAKEKDLDDSEMGAGILIFKGSLRSR